MRQTPYRLFVAVILFGTPNSVSCFQAGDGMRHRDRVYCIAFSPDSKFVASGAGGLGECLIRLWDLASGKELRQFKGYENHIYTIAFSPDGKYLASGGREDDVRIWEVATGK